MVLWVFFCAKFVGKRNLGNPYGLSIKLVIRLFSSNPDPVTSGNFNVSLMNDCQYYVKCSNEPLSSGP